MWPDFPLTLYCDKYGAIELCHWVTMKCLQNLPLQFRCFSCRWISLLGALMTFHGKCVDDGLPGRIRPLRFYLVFLMELERCLHRQESLWSKREDLSLTPEHSCKWIGVETLAGAGLRAGERRLWSLLGASSSSRFSDKCCAQEVRWRMAEQGTPWHCPLNATDAWVYTLAYIYVQMPHMID